MNLAIVCNGPSAEFYPGSKDFDLVAGVNWIVGKWRCDWWVFVDPKVFMLVTPIGCPRIFAPRRAIQRQPQRVRYLVDEHDPIILQNQRLTPWWPVEKTQRVPNWWRYSGSAALGLGIYLDATEVTVYGADMIGEEGFAGTASKNRTWSRWSQERRMWNTLADGMRQRGIQITRISHAYVT